MTDKKKGHPKKQPDETAPAAPAKTTQEDFAIVGIGASAGGLAAFEAFFAGMPADEDPGMAFVLVQHLAPDHKSILTDLVRRYTRMQVFEVEDGMVVRPNCTYIIPPNCDMAFLNGALQLLEPVAPRGQRLPIDFFFRSLAQDQHERAIGIVLSGTGSDGTLGLRAIKNEGGMVMAQSPATTEFDGMPSSAIATGLVDYELPPAEMPAQLIAYATHAFGKLVRGLGPPSSGIENAMQKIFVLMRAQTGHDFSLYKPGTVQRRIERRMAVHQIEVIGDYVKYLQGNPPEVETLFRDMLIGVTNFFRDPEAYRALESEVIPKLFADKQTGGVIRIWSAGCSTGEEAYSIAILMQERMAVLRQSFTVQIFATDIDSRAIDTARAGVYPASIAADVTPERLARFFTIEADGGSCRIHKNVRDMLVFSEQNVIKDPPFSRLDLISCRNLLIYLSAELQERLISVFHYALKPASFLFLGSSEGLGESSELFAVLDRKSKLYRRNEDFHGLQRTTKARFFQAMSAIDMPQPRHPATSAFPAKLPMREMMEQSLLQEIAPAGVLVNGQGDILYLHGRAGMYLEPAQGEAGINNILRMAREGLLPALAVALHKASITEETVRRHGLSVKTNGHFTKVNLSIRAIASGPAAAPEAPLYLVVLQEAPPLDPEEVPQPALASGEGGATDAEARIIALQKELRAKEEYLQSTHEELQSSSEELKSTNEEMQSVNEELQSTNEELETSKEELQSMNEELVTLNSELQTKVVDLTRVNNDMNNLLAGTNIGTVFVDNQLRILRFTPAAKEITNLIMADMGRPLAHIVSNLAGYDRLEADVQLVLKTLVPVEREVKTCEGKWFTMRIQPYRTLDNVIEGAAISFFDITEMVQTREALHAANEQFRLAVVLHDASDAITLKDLEGRILAWNPAAVRLYGWTEAEALQMNVRDRIPPAQREQEIEKMKQLSRAEILEPYQTQRLTKSGKVVEISMIATALLNEAGQVYAIATTERARLS